VEEKVEEQQPKIEEVVEKQQMVEIIA